MKLSSSLKTLVVAAAACMPVLASAQSEHPENTLFNLNVGARFDWQLDRIEGHTNDEYTGLRAKYLMFRVDGAIVPGLTYSWRQRLSKDLYKGNMFDATDWLYLRYQYKRFSVSAGKEVVAIGGYEYDRYPLDVYIPSVMWWNIPCFQLGVSAGFDVSPKDNLKFQVVQSPYHRYVGMNPNTYGYSLMWTGSHGIWNTLYSVNMFEHQPGRYINMIALGNRFETGRFELELDLFNRAASGQTFFFKDNSIVADLAYLPSDHWKVHLKYSFDRNKSGTDKDLTVGDGTSLQGISAGAEYYPLKKDKWSLRLHAAAGWYWGENAFAGDPMQHNTLYATVGLTWHMNLLHFPKKN